MQNISESNIQGHYNSPVKTIVPIEVDTIAFQFEMLWDNYNI